MEKDTEKIYISQERKNKILAWMIILLCFLAYYSAMSILAPVKKYRELMKEYGFVPDEKNRGDERLYSDSTYLAIFKEKSFLQSRITLAESDSVYLSVNLPDSSMTLEINGVSVHKANIKRMNVSRIFRGGNDYAILSMLALPLTADRNFATIEKEPVMIKIAPRDTSEYIPDIIPDTADYEPVNFILEMNSGIRLYVYQEERINAGDGIRLFLFDLGYRLRTAARTFTSVVTFRVPEYHPYIKLRIPRSDAKIIYRALPGKGQIAVYS